ncbi:MAG TPA: PKD domain-containing protein [Candidatus Dormibacteraeota bacterium]|nr:PKD domain-containing protein [Candidatus Dormibacteraeota bacterium]
MGRRTRFVLAAAALVAGMAVPAVAPGAALAVSDGVVISQVYGGGGNSGAPLQNDFVELFNRGAAPVSLAGWSLQYASATGTGTLGANAGQLTELTGSLAPGQYLLVQEGAGAGNGSPLPAPDVTDGTPIAMSATAGKVALVNTTTPLACNGGSTPCPPAALATIVDLVGYGGADFFEGAAPAPALSNTTAAVRRDGGCQDTDGNGADFAAAAPTPRTTASAVHTCGGPPPPPPPSARIHDIQGRAHLSPLNGQSVSGVTGIVTARRSNGYYLQDPDPDADEATSEGIFVFTSSAPAVAVGDSVMVSGRVNEFRPGGAASTNLTTTEITSPTTTVLSSGNELPPPIVIGAGGRTPPARVIEDDATGDVETSGTFDPATDGIDFDESLEGMRVQLDDAVAVGPTNSFGETPVVGDDGVGVAVRTPRGGALLLPDDANPQRLVAAPDIVPGPAVNVGDHFAAPLVGVLDYGFGNYRLELTGTPAAVHDGATPETTQPAGAHQLAVGTFNVENLDPTDPPSKFARLAGLVVDNLKAPDLLTVEEVQDDNGPADDGVVAADVTLGMLIGAIRDAGGPAYQFREIDPVNDQDGGEPGGNIRQVFLFRTDRGLSFVDRPGGGPTTATTVVNGAGGPELSVSPGRVAPADPAFGASRKPLAGEFLYQGHHLFVIGNHLVAKLGDQPLFGHLQPPAQASEAQRTAQTTILHDFVASILADDPNANVIVDGDLNDFEFSDSVTELKGAGLHDLIETLPQPERYSFVFEGNSQALDHVLVSGALAARPAALDVVHVNAEFADQASDHDPSLATVTLDDPPTAAAGGPYAVGEGGAVAVSATGADPEGGALSFAWDLDGDGTFETPGQSATFSAAGIDGPATRAIAVRVTDDGGHSAVATTTVQVTNVAPAVAAPKVSPEPSHRNAPAVAVTVFSDPGGSGDGPFACTVDYGDGTAPARGLVVSNACAGPAHAYARSGVYTITMRVTDKDGATGTATAQHTVA